MSLSFINPCDSVGAWFNNFDLQLETPFETQRSTQIAQIYAF